MTDPEAHIADPSARFDQIEGILKAYPDISEEELTDLKHWFNKEASSLEVASLASKENCRSGYTRFRSEHVDKFGFSDILILILIIAFISSVIFLSL